jgi:predicted AlkP superfamily pyrophosphatase or phosphodiesterase
MYQPLLVINIAGLGASAVGPQTPHLLQLATSGSGPQPVQPPVPALTSPSQATLLTGTPPARHGIVANGWYFHELAQVLNWQRSANLMSGEPLWQAARARRPGLRCANLFWRYATHCSCEVHVIERPTYWADGRKSPDIYCQPASLRDELFERLGPFPLFHFWGPAADIRSTRWIVDATRHLIQQQQLDLLLTYVPHLDYDHQRFGPDSSEGRQALRDMDAEVGRLLETARQHGMDVAVVSDYAFEPVCQPVFPNRALRQAGLLHVQAAENGELLEPGASAAFAVCDQQTAHVYVNQSSAVAGVQQLLAELDGIQCVLDRQQLHELGLDHPRCGQLLAIAEPGCWLAYPYWLDPSQAPDFAHCVAIHAKPGWDPSELFWRPGLAGKLHVAKRILQKWLHIRAPFDLISGDMSLVRGAHGRIPSSDHQRPLLITSWPLEPRDRLEMTELKGLLLQQLTGKPAE